MPTGGTGGSPPVLVLSGGTTITATPSDPTSLVLATPFSYTFTSSSYSPAPVYIQGEPSSPCLVTSTGDFSTNITSPTNYLITGSNAYVYSSNTFTYTDFATQSLSIVYNVPVISTPPVGQTLIAQMYVDYGFGGPTTGHT